VAKLMPVFNLRYLVSSLLLVEPRRLPKNNPLSNPRAFWIAEARGRLDGAMKRLPPASPERKKAEEMLGHDESFEKKCTCFFDDAAEDLEALEKLGVSPNVVAASIVRYAWNWAVRERDPVYDLLAQTKEQFEERLQTLEKAARELDEILPLATQFDLIHEAWTRLNEPSYLFTPDLVADAGLTMDDVPLLEGTKFGRGNLHRRASDTARSLRDLPVELDQAFQLFQKRGLTGRFPEEKVNRLLSLLATIFQAQTGDQRYKRIAHLLNASRLPRGSGPPFDKDMVRQRFKALEQTPLGHKIKLAVDSAIRNVSKLPF